MKKAYYYIVGLVAGLVNGIFGSGGGILVVPMLEYRNNEAKKAHATSIAIILALSAVSTILYFRSGNLDIKQGLMYIPGGIIGAVAGSLLLKKIPTKVLKAVFGIVLVASGVRILLK